MERSDVEKVFKANDEVDLFTINVNRTKSL